MNFLTISYVDLIDLSTLLFCRPYWFVDLIDLSTCFGSFGWIISFFPKHLHIFLSFVDRFLYIDIIYLSTFFLLHNFFICRLFFFLVFFIKEPCHLLTLFICPYFTSFEFFHKSTFFGLFRILKGWMCIVDLEMDRSRKLIVVKISLQWKKIQQILNFSFFAQKFSFFWIVFWEKWIRFKRKNNVHILLWIIYHQSLTLARGCRLTPTTSPKFLTLTGLGPGDSLTLS